ncbi:CobW family GTP-binding protein [Alloalcanivorax mobilis]|uniref:CobW family GTP-binding protein n=1 Tax=Alloalcanivorax mobilis TaxID=2019569 RepID=UPI000B5B3C69|nr:GTP-binding protein [Alloalcanivorax mobilis]ASK34512.1 cobalamin biosynthesis protein CobW [Alcanivorax sp. N3-2A]|tara:strand:- start:25619 stop:26602 length:984 start_codon:yes stop_codon:yes gene_type:complete
MAITPVVLLTGFLGSGKTTLLNQWIAARDDLAVIINELGEIGIDQHLARAVGTPVTLLAGGCVCCAVQGTLRTTLRNLFMARAAGDLPAFTQVVVETTGVADPFAVIGVLEQDPWLRKRFALSAVITAVDASAGPQVLRRHPEALEQVTAADLLLLTKTDRTDDYQALEQTLGALNPGAPRWPVRHGDSEQDPLALTFSRRCRITGTLTPLGASGTQRHAHGLYPAVLRIDGARPYALWREALDELSRLSGERLIRLKGLLCVDKLDGPLLVQGVASQPLEMTPLAVWPEDGRHSRLVLITDGDADFPVACLERVRAIVDAGDVDSG